MEPKRDCQLIRKHKLEVASTQLLLLLLHDLCQLYSLTPLAGEAVRKRFDKRGEGGGRKSRLHAQRSESIRAFNNLGQCVLTSRPKQRKTTILLIFSVTLLLCFEELLLFFEMLLYDFVVCVVFRLLFLQPVYCIPCSWSGKYEGKQQEDWGS